MTLRRLFVVGLICVALCQPAILQASATVTSIRAMIAYGPLAMFTTEGAAQAHCPSDTVVWLNTKTVSNTARTHFTPRTRRVDSVFTRPS